MPEYADTIVSICPKGWNLPGYIGDQGFVNLTTTYLRISKDTSDLASSVPGTLRAAPLSFVRSGAYDYDTSTLDYRGSRGRFWSSTAGSTTNANNLYFSSSSIYPQIRNLKGNGFAVRCVAH